MAPYIPDEQINVGSFIPTTYIWDVTQLFSVDVTSPEFKELLVRLYQYVSNIAQVVNTKESALYVTEQFANSQAWFNPLSPNQDQLRGCFRKVINVGALPAGVTTVAHNLAPTNAWKFTYIGGVASDTVGLNYYPLPFAGVAGNIEVRVDNANVIITNNSGQVFTDTYIVLEFLKS